MRVKCNTDRDLFGRVEGRGVGADFAYVRFCTLRTLILRLSL